MVILALLLALMPPFEDLPSGPKPGTSAPTLPAFSVLGPISGEARDLAADRGAKPTIYAFVQAERWDRPLARFLKGLDTSLKQRTDAGDAVMVAVWLTEEPRTSIEYLPRAQQSLRFDRTNLAVFEGPTRGPEGWALSDFVAVTLVSVRDGKIVRSVGLNSWDEADGRRAIDALFAADPKP